MINTFVRREGLKASRQIACVLNLTTIAFGACGLVD